MSLYLRRWFKLGDESGQGMVEYGLIIALVAIALIAVLTSMSGGLSSVFTKITNQVYSASS